MAPFKTGLTLLCAMCMLLATTAWAALQPIPPLETRVTDLTQTLSEQERASLEQKLTTFEREKGSQIAVLIVSTTQPEDIAQYSIRVVDAWKIGREKQDDGVLVLVAKDDRKMRIEVGRGLEGAIPDLYAKRIISEVLSPHFKQGDFYGGLNAATDKIMGLTVGEGLPATGSVAASGKDLFELLPLFFFGALIGGMILRGMFGTFVGSTLNGGLMGALVWGFGAAFGAVALVGFLTFIFTMVMGGRGINGYSQYPGGFGGGGFGNGGYGGRDIFTGGGGGFGGGGASGDW